MSSGVRWDEWNPNEGVAQSEEREATWAPTLRCISVRRLSRWVNSFTSNSLTPVWTEKHSDDGRGKKWTYREQIKHWRACASKWNQNRTQPKIFSTNVSNQPIRCLNLQKLQACCVSHQEAQSYPSLSVCDAQSFEVLVLQLRHKNWSWACVWKSSFVKC